ncbi:MAG TPA: hypothetical protein VN540_01900 [Clostridia bacterium]|nr:hypothetical protein [Clostridia bacterium]
MNTNIAAYKNGRWVQEILALQHADGSWGHFHSLGGPISERSMTTEQALRRLQILGFTRDDPAVARALNYLHACLAGECTPPDRREKTHDWDAFEQLTLATWVRRFRQDDPLANAVAAKWRYTIENAFSSDAFSEADYLRAYAEAFGKKAKGDRLVDFVAFYPISLLAGEIGPAVERAYFDYILSRENGIYYIYGKSLLRTPETFQSKEASRYLAAVELLLRYPNAYVRESLKHVAAWLTEHRKEDGSFDMGQAVRDGVYFPLSDSWRNPDDRRRDCTRRIETIIAGLTASST